MFVDCDPDICTLLTLQIASFVYDLVVAHLASGNLWICCVVYVEVPTFSAQNLFPIHMDGVLVTIHELNKKQNTALSMVYSFSSI